MPGVLGSAFSSTDDLHKAPGTMVDAGIRRHRNVFDFAESGVGGTTNALTLAKLREGCAVDSIRIQTDANLSAINLSAGIAGSTAKYVAAAAGPNATRQELLIKLTALDDDALAAAEDIILTPSGNWPASGSLVTSVYASKR